MTLASTWLRRVELSLGILGIALLVGSFGETFSRWHYQAQQERALDRGPAVVSPRIEQRAIGVSADATVSTPVPPIPEPPAETVERTPLTQPVTANPADRVASARRRVERAPVPMDDPVAIDPAALGRIEIPRIGVEAIVNEGADEETLSRAVGLVRGSARPGEPGNMVLAGHRDTFFRPLRKIRLNDRIRMIVPPNTYEYQVESMRVVTPEETSVLDSRGVEELTLITCYPFRYIGPAPERFIVSAKRVN